MRIFTKRDRIYGPTTPGFCTTIMHCATARIFRKFFARNSTHVAPQPPYSPDLARCDFSLFPKLKRPLRRSRFESIEDIELGTVRALKAIPTDCFSACFEGWRKHWHKCIGFGGIILRGPCKFGRINKAF